MRSKLILFVIISFLSVQVQAKKVSSTKLIQNVFTTFESGKYENVIPILNDIESRIKPNSKKGAKLQGLVHYWKGMCYSRMNDYELAEEFLGKAIASNYDASDLYYEYGQVLYVAEKYREARIAFKKSVKAKYKMAVSLYYIASISYELKDYKKAVSFFNMLEKLPKEESKDVLQAARMQIADIYLIQVEKGRDPFSAVKKYVIPQYDKALKVNEDSRLAEEIRAKVERLQRKYEIILFKMRNGKPTARPPYYVKASILYGQNDNITTLDEDSKADADEDAYSSSYYTVSAFSRYSFYPSSSFSYAPELSAGYTKYNSSNASVLPYNKYYLKTALKMNFEHIYNNAPATFYMDLDYTYNADDADADESFAFADNTYGITLSEELQIFENNPSTFRFNYSTTQADEEASTYSSYGFTFEQLILLRHATVFWYNNFNLTRYEDSASESLNTNALTSRVDFIFPTLWKLFNPTLYTSILNTNYIEDSNTGVTSLVTYGVNLNRPVAKKLYLTADFSMSTQTADQDEDNYVQNVMTFTLDYIY